MEETQNHSKQSRIFLAIGTSAQLQQKICDWQKNYNKRNPADGAKLRLIAPQNLHLTLIPPWYATKEEISLLIHHLQNLTPTLPRPFTVVFNQITFGPKPNEPRLIWLSGETPPALFDLKNKVEQCLANAPAPGEPAAGEKRPFKLHLTVARFRGEDFRHFKTQPLDKKINWEEEISAFYLMESHLSPKGSDYAVIEKFGLPQK
ncbi:MAG: RNA 2',3'-cyclic phosphodiesterase [Candidatus Margulisiibacteriota bacterium]